MRSSLVVAIAVSTSVLSTSGCYMDGAWRAPTWNNMTAWWQKPKAESTSMAAGPSVHLPSQNTSPTTTTTPGAASAITASTQGGGVSPAYDATKASYNPVSPNMYPSTGMAAFNTPGAANRANTAAYDASSRGVGAYATGGPYDNRPAHDYAQTGPYDTVYGVANRAPANNTTPGVTQNPYANNPAQPATPAITDRSIAAGAQQDRYRDTAPTYTNPPAANTYIPVQNDPRVAARDTTAANPTTNPSTNPAAANPVIGPGTVRTRSENPYDPGETGYNPGNTGYQPPPGSGYDPAMNGTSAPVHSQGAAAIPNQTQTASAQPAPRRESSWSPGGTSRYPGANPAAATTAANTLPHSQPVHQPAAAPTSHYNDPRDPNTPDAPARVHDPSRYDDMR